MTARYGAGEHKMRRIITGLDANGKSTVVYSGPPQSMFHTTGAKVGSLEIKNTPAFIADVPRGHACIIDIWETDGPPLSDGADPMAEPRPFSIEPPGKGFRIRYFSWGADLDSSAMHATDTLDINYIISGAVELLLEEGRSVMLKAGDSIVIPGVLHGWRAGPEGVTMINLMQKLA
jgi:mannose-6-phosphate isomerase-like protein (cupin superfamily)